MANLRPSCAIAKSIAYSTVCDDVSHFHTYLGYMYGAGRYAQTTPDLAELYPSSLTSLLKYFKYLRHCRPYTYNQSVKDEVEYLDIPCLCTT